GRAAPAMGKDDRHDPRWRWRDLRRHADEREKRFLLACQFRRRCTPDDAAEYFPECDHDSCGFERSLAAASGRRWCGWWRGCNGRGFGGNRLGHAGLAGGGAGAERAGGWGGRGGAMPALQGGGLGWGGGAAALGATPGQELGIPSLTGNIVGKTGFASSAAGSSLIAGGALVGQMLAMDAFRRGSAVEGLAGGAMAGASIGTMIAPGIGTAIGAGVGAIAGLVSGLFGGGAQRRAEEAAKRA